MEREMEKRMRKAIKETELELEGEGRNGKRLVGMRRKEEVRRS